MAGDHESLPPGWGSLVQLPLGAQAAHVIVQRGRLRLSIAPPHPPVPQDERLAPVRDGK